MLIFIIAMYTIVSLYPSIHSDIQLQRGSGETAAFYNCLCFVRGMGCCQPRLQITLLKSIEYFCSVFHLNLPSAVRVNSF